MVSRRCKLQIPRFRGLERNDLAVCGGSALHSFVRKDGPSESSPSLAVEGVPDIYPAGHHGNDEVGTREDVVGCGRARAYGSHRMTPIIERYK